MSFLSYPLTCVFASLIPQDLQPFQMNKIRGRHHDHLRAHLAPLSQASPCLVLVPIRPTPSHRGLRPRPLPVAAPPPRGASAHLDLHRGTTCTGLQRLGHMGPSHPSPATTCLVPHCGQSRLPPAPMDRLSTLKRRCSLVSPSAHQQFLLPPRRLVCRATQSHPTAQSTRMAPYEPRAARRLQLTAPSDPALPRTRARSCTVINPCPLRAAFKRQRARCGLRPRPSVPQVLVQHPAQSPLVKVQNLGPRRYTRAHCAKLRWLLGIRILRWRDRSGW